MGSLTSADARPRRAVLPACARVCVVSAIAACTSSGTSATSATTSAAIEQRVASSDRAIRSGDLAKADAVRRIVRQEMADKHLKAVIVRVTMDGKEILTEAVGNAMTGVPATIEMHFRNGAVAISYVATVLLQLVDEHTVSLDDKVSRWLPHVKYADQVTLGQLAQMTSGYYDYVQDTGFLQQVFADPFRHWTPEELVAISTSHDLLYRPGTNWSYAHSNYVILGLALEKITGKPMTMVMQERILGPLHLTHTTDPDSPAIPEPVLHAFVSERREALHIPAAVPFYEESTFWSPSWSIARGAIQTTNIDDMHDSAVAIGTGKLLRPASYARMIAPTLRGKTTRQPGCPTCAEMGDFYTYGYGIVISGNWLVQNPLFFGFAGAMSYLPSQKIAIAVAATYEPEAFDPITGSAPNHADDLWRKIGRALAPGDPPPMPPPKR